MLTRRTFFASLAALAVSPRVAAVVAAPRLTVNPVVLPLLRELRELPVLDVGRIEVFDYVRLNWRDDDDTILELR